MKKFYSIALVLVLTVAMLAGCRSTKPVVTTAPTLPSTRPTTAPTTAPTTMPTTAPTTQPTTEMTDPSMEDLIPGTDDTIDPTNGANQDTVTPRRIH